MASLNNAFQDIFGAKSLSEIAGIFAVNHNEEMKDRMPTSQKLLELFSDNGTQTDGKDYAELESEVEYLNEQN